MKYKIKEVKRFEVINTENKVVMTEERTKKEANIYILRKD